MYLRQSSLHFKVRILNNLWRIYKDDVCLRKYVASRLAFTLLLLPILLIFKHSFIRGAAFQKLPYLARVALFERVWYLPRASCVQDRLIQWFRGAPIVEWVRSFRLPYNVCLGHQIPLWFDCFIRRGGGIVVRNHKILRKFELCNDILVELVYLQIVYSDDGWLRLRLVICGGPHSTLCTLAAWLVDDDWVELHEASLATVGVEIFIKLRPVLGIHWAFINYNHVFEVFRWSLRRCELIVLVWNVKASKSFTCSAP